MNQAKRDMLTFLNANGVVTPLPQAEKNRLLDVKLFSSYCERSGRPIINWTKVSKANFNSIVLYMEEEKVTIFSFSMAGCLIATKLRNVTSTTMVTPPPMINFTSASTDIKVLMIQRSKLTTVPSSVKHHPNSKPMRLHLSSNKTLFMTSSVMSTKAHLASHMEARSTTLCLIWTQLLGLARSLHACPGLWHSLLIRISRRNLQIPL